MQYRPEIDGLRAVAVVAVILFHAGFSAFQGGFVGVDIFFVISGFLITGLILEEIHQGYFSFTQFYVRRVKRILPALFFVVFASIIAAWFLLLPDQMREFSQSVMANSAMVSNLFFLSQSGYFDTDTALKPLLHTWSLSVEEQFYLLFPFALLFLSKKMPARFWIGIAFLLLASFFYCCHISAQAPSRNFYLIYSRGWELLAGALLAIFLTKHHAFNPKKWLANSLSLLGFLLIALSIYFVDESVPFPSVYTLPAIIGTILVIAYTRKHTLLGASLAHPFVVGIGLISYSLYLWHQPVFAFARVWYGTLSIMQTAIALLIILLLALFSWRFVEKPFRRSFVLNHSKILLVGFLMMVFLFGLGYWVDDRHSGVTRFNQEQQLLISRLDTNKHQQYFDEKKHARINEGKVLNGALFKHGKWVAVSEKFKPDEREKILVIGDSFGEDFLNGVEENGYLKNAQIRFYDISPICQFYLGDEAVIEKFIPGKSRNYCRVRHEQLIQFTKMIAKSPIDVVIVVSNWREWAAENINATLQKLALNPQQKIIVIGAKGFMPISRRQLIQDDAKVFAHSTVATKSQVLKINQILLRELGDQRFVDQQRIFCPISHSCPVFGPHGDVIAYDGVHLSQEGAALFTKAMFAQHVFRRTLSDDALKSSK